MEHLLIQQQNLLAMKEHVLQEIERIQAALDTDRAALALAQSEYAAAQKEYDRFRQSAESYNCALEENAAKYASVESEFKKLKDRRDDLQKQFAKLPGLAFGKKRELKSLIEQNEAAISATEQARTALTNQRMQLERNPISSAPNTIINQLNELSEKQTSWQSSIDCNLAKLETQKAVLVKTKEDLAQVALDIESLQQKRSQQASEPVAAAPVAASSEPTRSSSQYPSSAHPVFTKLEALYPERKVFALDSIDGKLRENIASMYQQQGYRTVEDFLAANGFSLISGDEVKKIRSFVLYTPGTEPDVIRSKVENMLRLLDEYYPDKIISRGIQKDHKSLSQTVSGLYQWLGYADAGAMLEAYGFRYNVGSSGRPSNDYDAVIDALIEKYRDQPKPQSMGILIYDNPEYKSQLKTLQNKANELFGMTLKKYFEELGLLDAKQPSAGTPAPIRSGTGTMQDAAFAMLKDIYSKLDPSLYGTFKDACQQLSYFNVKKNKAGQIYIFRALSIPDKVTIPYGINFISDDAFAGQTTMQELTLPSSLEKVGAGTFSGCIGLKHIHFAEGLVSIGNRAFDGCSSLTEVSFPSTLESIGIYAFRNCGSLSQVVFANPTTIYEDNVFEGCQWKPEKTDIPDDADTKDFLYTVDRKNLVTVTGYTGSASVLVIPQKIDGKIVCAIGKSAFEGNRKLREISMSDYITNLQNYAFRDCANLERVVLSNNISRLYASTFSGCHNLKRINLPDHLFDIKQGTFKDSQLQELHIGKSIQKIDVSLFYNGEFDAFTGEFKSRRSINHITVDPDNPYLSAEGCCVFSADRTQLHAVLGNPQSYQVPYGVTRISDNAFEGLAGLTDITLPETLEEIGTEAFSRTGLRSIQFGSGIRSIGDSAFAYCKNLASVIFDEGIESIGMRAFSGCPLAAVSLPASVRSLGVECFPCFESYNPNMRDFRISEDNPRLKADGSALYQIDGDTVTLFVCYGHTYRQQVFSLWGSNPESPAYIVAENTTAIGRDAFRRCTNIGEVVLPYGLQVIEDHAFDGCTNLSTVNIPETVTHIGAYAFSGCRISSIRIPESVREIHDGAFSMGDEWDNADSALAQIDVAAQNPNFSVIDSCLVRNGDGLELIAYFGDEDSVVLPENTVKICARAFYKTCISEITIPASVHSIGEHAFHRCHHLRRLVIGLAVPENGIEQATVYIPEPDTNAYGFADVSARDQYMDCIRVDGNGALFDFVKYDGLFDTISDPKNKILVATSRLKSAVGLIPHYRERYLAYLQHNAQSAVEIVITYDDLNGLTTLAELGVFTRKNIQQVIDVASTAGKPEILSYLMNYQNSEIGFHDLDWEL